MHPFLTAYNLQVPFLVPYTACKFYFDWVFVAGKRSCQDGNRIAEVRSFSDVDDAKRGGEDNCWILTLDSEVQILFSLEVLF